MENQNSQAVHPEQEEYRWRWCSPLIWELFGLGLAHQYKTEYLGECDIVHSPEYINRHWLR